MQKRSLEADYSGRFYQRKTSTRLSMGNEAQEGNQDQASIQVEIQAKRPWRTEVIWKKLHQDLLTSGNLVFNLTFIDTLSH